MPSLFTNPIETGNTIASINIVRKEVTAILRVVNIVVQVFVLPYYVYLIYKNWTDPFYIVVYGLLLFVSVLAFILELILNRKLRNKDEELAKKKMAKGVRINSLVFKGLKYAVRLLILGIAAFQIVTKDDLTALYVVTTVLSAIMIIGQILLDVFVSLCLRYFEFIRLGFEADMRESPILNMGKSEQVIARKLESEAESLGVDEKTRSERNKMALIKEEMAKNKEESKKKATEQIKHRSKLIRRQKFADAVSSEEMKAKIMAIYEKKLVEAEKVLLNEKKLAASLDKAKSRLEGIPDGLDGLSELSKTLDEFESLSEEKRLKVLAAVLYFLDPFTAIMDLRGEIGYADDEYVAELLIEEAQEE